VKQKDTSYVLYLLFIINYNWIMLLIDKWIISRHLIQTIIMQNNSALTNSINLPKPNIQMILHWEYMNNTKTRTLARVTVLIAATLVVGMTFAATATTTQSAFAYQMKGAGQDDGSNNGNTLTPQTGRQYGIVSGFDNSFNQELKNLICTHPSATCSTEGSEGPANTAAGSSGSSPSSSATR
jgi:hypothetical protein